MWLGTGTGVGILSASNCIRGEGLKKDEYLEKQIHVVKTALCSFDVLQQKVNYGKRKRSERTF